MAKSNSSCNGSIAAAAYYRMSRDKQVASIPRQREAVEAYAAQHGYKIRRTYADEGIEGDSSTDKRQEFQRMIADARSGKFKAVLVWNLSRMTRSDLIDSAAELRPLRQAGVQVVTTDKGVVEWNDFGGRILYAIETEGHNAYVRNMSRDATSGLLKKAQRGEWPAGRPPRGFDADENDRLVLGDPTDAKLVRRIYQKYLSGASLQGLVDELNTEDNGKWYRSTVRYILTNELYTGTFVWNARCQAKYNGVRNGKVEPNVQQGFNDRSDLIVIPDNHPAIIERKTFDTVQRRLADRGSKLGRAGISTPQPNKYALTGLLRCDKCDSRMYGHTVSGYQYFVCGGYLNKGKSFCDRNAVRQDDILEHVIAAIERKYMNPTTVKRMRDELHKQVRQSVSKVSASRLRQQVQTLDKRLAKYKRRLVEVDSDMVPVVQEQIRDLQDKRQRLQTELKAAQTPQKRLIADVDTKVDAAMKLFADLRKTLQRADTARLRDFLHAAISKVVLRIEKTPHGRRHKFNLLGGDIYEALNLFGSPRSTLA